jgi:hypothetical protein
MLLDVILQDKVLTGLIIGVGLIWLYVFFKNVRYSKRSSDRYAVEYNNVLHADEFKVKGRFEE